jgi:hypothetical protein
MIPIEASSSARAASYAMQEEIAVGHHGHARRKREGKPCARRRQILKRAIDYADVWPEPLISVDRLVERWGCATHVGIVPCDAARTTQAGRAPVDYVEEPIKGR